MKKIISILLSFTCIVAIGQVPISVLPSYSGNPSGGMVPVTVGNRTYKIDPKLFGYTSWDSLSISYGTTVDTFKFYNRTTLQNSKILYTHSTGGGSADSGTFVTKTFGANTYYPKTGNPSNFLTSISGSQVTSALGFTPYSAANPAGYITGINSGNVTTALGYTPYSSTNPNGYISSINSGNVTTALGFTPYNATNPNGYLNQASVWNSLSLTTTGTSGPATYNSATGAWNIPQYTGGGAGSTAYLDTTNKMKSNISYIISWNGVSTLSGYGDSYAAGYPYTANSGDFKMYATRNGLTYDDQSAGGTGWFTGAKKAALNIPATGSVNGIIIRYGFNDVRRIALSSSALKTFRRAQNEFRFIMANQIYDATQFSYGNSTTKVGTWVALDAHLYGGKAGVFNAGDRAAMSTTLNDSLKYSFTGESVQLAYLNTMTGSTFQIWVDSLLYRTITSNAVDGVDDGSAVPGYAPGAAFIYGFGAGSHVLKVIKTSSSDSTIIDFVSAVKTPIATPPVLVCQIPYMTAAGYATIGGNLATRLSMDSSIEVAKAEYRAPGYAIGTAYSNDFYDTAHDVWIDNIHPVFPLGYGHLLAADMAVTAPRAITAGSFQTSLNAGSLLTKDNVISIGATNFMIVAQHTYNYLEISKLTTGKVNFVNLNPYIRTGATYGALPTLGWFDSSGTNIQSSTLAYSGTYQHFTFDKAGDMAGNDIFNTNLSIGAGSATAPADIGFRNGTAGFGGAWHIRAFPASYATKNLLSGIGIQNVELSGSPVAIYASNEGSVTIGLRIATYASNHVTAQIKGGVTADSLIQALGGFAIAGDITQTTGTAYTVALNVANVYINPASTLSAFAITTPASAVNGQEFFVYYGGTMTTGAVVTTPTIVANSGQSIIGPAITAAAGSAYRYHYNSANTTWFGSKLN